MTLEFPVTLIRDSVGARVRSKINPIFHLHTECHRGDESVSFLIIFTKVTDTLDLITRNHEDRRRLEAPRAPLYAQDVELVGLVHLLQEDEGEDCVRAKAEVVRSEAFPEREESLRTDYSQSCALQNSALPRSLQLY